MHVMYIAGVMSGTSLDGIDVALVHIEGSGVDSKIELIHFTTVPFCNDMKNEIQQALSIETSNVQLICSLNFKLGLCFANAVKEVCKEAQFSFETIRFNRLSRTNDLSSAKARRKYYFFNIANWGTSSNSI